MLPLHELLATGNDSEKFRKLLKTGVDPNACDDNRDTPLHIAAARLCRNSPAMNATLSMARDLIAFGAEVNEKNKSGYSPLLRAMFGGNPRMAELLLQHYADVHATDRNGNTALHLAITAPNNLLNLPPWDEYYATRKHILEMVKILMRFNPDLNHRNVASETPVLLAAKYQDLPVLKELLERKANANCMNSQSINVSPMYWALNRPSINLDIVLELLRHRGRFYSPDVFGTYISRLKNASLGELEKAKSVLKVFFLGKESLSNRHVRMLEELSKTKKFPLSRFILDLRSEISQMSEDKLESCENSQMSQDRLESEFSIYNMAQRGFFCTCEEKKDLFSHFFDAVPQKLKNSEYPLYHDLIASGISISHVRGKFGANIVKFLNNKDVSHLLISYLSHLDMFNFIVAFTE